MIAQFPGLEQTFQLFLWTQPFPLSEIPSITLYLHLDILFAYSHDTIHLLHENRCVRTFTEIADMLCMKYSTALQ